MFFVNCLVTKIDEYEAVLSLTIKSMLMVGHQYSFANRIYNPM